MMECDCLVSDFILVVEKIDKREGWRKYIPSYVHYAVWQSIKISGNSLKEIEEKRIKCIKELKAKYNESDYKVMVMRN